MSEQREAIAEVIHDAWNLSGVPYERGNIFKKDKRRSQADAVIAHLYQRADDPEVVEEVAKAITSTWNRPSPNPTAFIASAETLARAATIATLTALLGPKPSGEESEHGQ